MHIFPKWRSRRGDKRLVGLVPIYICIYTYGQNKPYRGKRVHSQTVNFCFSLFLQSEFKQVNINVQSTYRCLCIVLFKY